MFGAGFGGGLILGRTMAPKDTNEIGAGRVIQNPGPIVPIGQFTSNLQVPGGMLLTVIYPSNLSKKTVLQL